jgi:O-antigen/teichoic acid export membrane protein
VSAKDADASGAEDFASGARILTIGIASTGLFTFAYLALSSKLLSPANYSRLSICWAIMYVILCVIYRPVEQLLSRTIADRQARGATGHVLRTPAVIQASFAALFLVLSLALHDQIKNHLFKGSAALYWILVVGVLAYAASYFARGWLAGHKRFALYGGLVFLESTSRFLFAVAAAIAVGHELGPIGIGMAIAPFASLCVIPFAFSRITGGGSRAVEIADAAREGPAHGAIEEAATDLSLRHGSGFAAAVVAIMFSEQTLMNAGVLIVALGRGGGGITTGLAGFVFNVLLIVRAPLQLFQAVQTSILPHLTSMEAADSGDEFHRAVRMTLLVIGAFAAAVALGLVLIGPFVMKLVLSSSSGHHYPYNRFGLAIVGIGMGLHLASGALNQALLARARSGRAAAAWLVSAAVFVVFVAAPTFTSKVARVEVGYCLATAILAATLWLMYRRSARVAPPAAVV